MGQKKCKGFFFVERVETFLRREMSAQLDENLNICGALIAPDFNENQGIFQLITALWVFTIFLGLLAIGLTFHLCYKHFENYHKSQYQKWIVRILL